MFPIQRVEHRRRRAASHGSLVRCRRGHAGAFASVVGRRAAGNPGVIYINGEKIYYYRNLLTEVIPWHATTTNPIDLEGLGNKYKPEEPRPNNQYDNEILVIYAEDAIVSYEGNVYRATGNISGLTFNFANVELFDPNVLDQITRGVDGTGIPMIHATGTGVVDASLDQRLPGNVFTVHTSTWLNMTLDEADGTGLDGSVTPQALYIKAEVPPAIPAWDHAEWPEDKDPILKKPE